MYFDILSFDTTWFERWWLPLLIGVLVMVVVSILIWFFHDKTFPVFAGLYMTALVGGLSILISAGFLDIDRSEERDSYTTVWGEYYTTVWGEYVDILKEDSNDVIARIVEADDPDAIISVNHSHSTKGPITVTTGDRKLTTCEMVYTPPEGDTIHGWVECMDEEQRDEVMTFGKDA